MIRTYTDNPLWPQRIRGEFTCLNCLAVGPRLRDDQQYCGATACMKAREKRNKLRREARRKR